MSSEANSQTYDLNKQVAIITGGGRGLGRVFAQTLSKAGAKVAITARTESELKETVRLIEQSGGTALPFTVDVTDEAKMISIVAEVERQLGPVDILLNNAAVLTPLGHDWEINSEEWWRTFEVNVRGPFLCTKAVLPGMMARRKGRIVNLSSIAAHGVFPFGTAYCSSKAALSHMTKLQAAAIREYGISMFALSPSGSSAMVEILATSPKVTEELRVAARETLSTNSGITESVHTLMFLLSGQADVFTGCHISWWDSTDELLRRTDEILQNDLYRLGLRV